LREKQELAEGSLRKNQEAAASAASDFDELTGLLVNGKITT
jgi:hypothetical protein